MKKLFHKSKLAIKTTLNKVIFIEKKDLIAIKNLCFASIVAFLVILASYFAFSRAALLYFKNGGAESEEIAWYVINDNFVKIEDESIDNYYQFFQSYIQEIVNSLPHSILPSEYKIEIIVLNDNSINAFAAPGGRIILTKGLLDQVRSENGLMFVVGHEIGHLHNKDHLKEFSKSLSASIISTLFFGSNIEITELLLMVENPDTKQAEFEADQWGLKILMALYGHAGGATEFFNILAENKIGEAKHESHFSSHPSTSSRSNSISQKIKENNFPTHQLISFD